MKISKKSNFAPQKILLVFFLLLVSISSLAQKTQKELEAERSRLQLEIKKMNSLLFSTQKEEKDILNQISNLNQKIRIRTKLIKTINQESSILQSKINRNEKKIQKLRNELAELKEDYANMIYKSYKSKSMQSRMLFLLSSENFHQAYKRLRYMEQYAKFRKEQGEEIIQKTKQIELVNNELKTQKIQKANLLASYREAQQKIESEKQLQENLVVQVQSKEQEYRAEIKKKQEAERKLDKQIEKLIRDAIAASKAKNTGATSKGFFLTPEAKALASKFALNRGKLPWPVINALVVRNYGKIPHETLRGITIQSNGIHIATNKGAMAKAIFEGTVLAIQVDDSGMKSVYLQHGNYISLYVNLETVSVQKGDKITLNQTLGMIHTDKVTGKTVLKFQIWKDTKTENPKSWLLRL